MRQKGGAYRNDNVRVKRSGGKRHDLKSGLSDCVQLSDPFSKQDSTRRRRRRWVLVRKSDALSVGRCSRQKLIFIANKIFVVAHFVRSLQRTAVQSILKQGDKI